MRTVLSVISGVVVGSVIILIIETLGHKVYPVTMNMDSATDEAKAEFMKTLPAGAMLMVLLAWALGAFAAGIISTLISKEHISHPALRSGAVLLALTIANMLMIPHPIWFWIGSFLVFIPFAWLGFKLVSPKSA